MRSILCLLAAIAAAVPIAANPACPSVQWTSPHEWAKALPSTWSILPIDYDEDGVPDLLTYEEGIGEQRVLNGWRGLGDGTFAPPLLIADPITGGPVAVDVNGDGHLDVIAPSDRSFEVFHGNGTAFDSAVSYPTDYQVSEVVAGNFDSDAAVELVAMSAGSDLFVLYDYVSGAFIESRRVTTGDLPTALSVADVDGDGRADVVVGEWIPQTMSVFFREADGTFSAPVSMPCGDFPSSLQVGDVNGDGRADIAVSERNDANVRVFRNLGSRSFTQMAVLPLASPAGEAVDAGDLILRDVNGDALLDLAVPVFNGRGGVVTLIGKGDGRFLTSTWSAPAAFEGSTTAAAADVDGDGVMDLVTAPYGFLRVSKATCATQVVAMPQSTTITDRDTAIINVVISGFDSSPPFDRGTLTAAGATGYVFPDARGEIDIPGLAAGTHEIPVTFTGNAEVPGGVSEPVTITVTSTATRTTISTPAAQPVYGTAWPVTVTIRNADGDELITTYTLSVDGAETTHQTSAGAVSLFLEPGPHTIQARFAGLNDFPPSESDVLSVTALKATPSMAMSGALTARQGTANALQFTLSGPEGTQTPSGVVRLYEGASLLSTGTIAGGVASVSATLSRGSHDVRAVYSGDARFVSRTSELTLHVVPNAPFAIEASGLQSVVRVAYVLPPGAQSPPLLYRRVAGAANFQQYIPTGEGSGLAIDGQQLTPGVAYEYQMRVSFPDGSTASSNIDRAILFTDDALSAGVPVRLAHFAELRLAVNELRGDAGLPLFNFAEPFGAFGIVKAQHVNGLRTALNEARAALGMTTGAFPSAAASSTKITAADIQQIRELAR